MAKADAGIEIPKLAEKAGFSLVADKGSVVGFFHDERQEAFMLRTDDSAFVYSRWHARTRYAAIVDKRSQGEFGKEGRSLTGNAKRRPVGVDDVRIEMVASQSGMEVGYMELKRRIRTPDWAEQ